MIGIGTRIPPSGSAHVAAFDATALSPTSSGELRLPWWLHIACPTAERSAQTSASTVKTGFAANAARAYSADGVTWGLLVEPATENVVDETDLTQWAGAAKPTIHSATTPAGTVENCEAEDDDAVAVEEAIYTLSLPAGQPYVLSAWTQLLTSPGSDGSLLFVHGIATASQVYVTAAEGAWTYHGDAASALSIGGWAQASIYVRVNFPADLGSTRVWGYQFERRIYPTSFMGADNATFSRSADTLKANAAAIVRGGYFDIEIVFAPQYAHDETEDDHDLIYFGAGDRLWFDKSAATFVLDAGGGSAASAAVTFSRRQTITIRATHSAAGLDLVVSGCTTGNGTTNEIAGAPISVPPFAYLFGDSSGTEEGVVLYGVDPHI